MKLLFLLNNDIHAAKLLELLHDDLRLCEVRVVLSQRVGNTANLPPQLLEMKDLEACNIAEKFSYRCDFYSNINSTFALKEIANFAPDLIISIRFGQIVKAPLIAIPRFGVVNLHSGILPKYRGIMASFWAILHDEEKLGMTLHYIHDATIDTGEIIACTVNEIDRNASLLTNIHNLYDSGAQAIREFLQKIKNNEKVVTISQKNLPDACYFSYPQQQDIVNFTKKMPLY